MKQIVLGLLVLIGVNAGAAAAKPISLQCESVDRDGLKVYLTVDGLTVTGEGEETQGKLRSFEMTILNLDEKEYDVIPATSGGSWEGRDVKNTAYSGRRYANHLKFELTRHASKSAGSQVDYADLIVSPAYLVEKTIPQANHWNKDWTWDIEVRKHSAVLPLSINDHHGDYVPMSCFSTAIVNEKRPKSK
ncbi:MAG: hypothetical protein AB7N80_03310 [Bdellovibrionales bacterium]